MRSRFHFDIHLMAKVVSSTAHRLPAAVTPGLSVLLSIEHLTTRFDALIAVDDVSLTIHSGSITGLIGPNGAGKSTLFNTIAGEIKAAAGSVTFNNRRIDWTHMRSGPPGCFPVDSTSCSSWHVC